MIFPVIIIGIFVNILLHICPTLSGRTTNKYTSLPGGGFHHHGGFLAGYFNFFKGSRDNPADSFSERYEEVPEDISKYPINHSDDDQNQEMIIVYTPPLKY